MQEIITELVKRNLSRIPSEKVQINNGGNHLGCAPQTERVHDQLPEYQMRSAPPRPHARQSTLVATHSSQTGKPVA
jgi:hypothetical protein